MKNFRGFIFGSLLLSLLLVAFPLFSDQSEIVNKEHLKFYKSGQFIRIAKLLNFGQLRGKKLVSVTVHYSMIKSKLSGEFMISGRSFGIKPLQRGLKEEVTHVFNRAVPSEMGFYFHGKRGQQVQVRSVSAVIKPHKLVLADPIRKKKIKKLYKYAKLKRILPKERSLDMINPVGGDNILLGSQVEILWQMRGMRKRVTGELWKGNKRIKLIFDRLRGSEEKYLWKASGREIFPGGNYRIKITTIDNQFVAETGRFSIFQELSKLEVRRYINIKKRPGFNTPRVADPVSLKIIEPNHNTQWEIHRTYPIRWNSRGLGSNRKVALALTNNHGGMAKIIAVTENTGVYNYTVPYPIGLFGDDVKVIITPLKYRRVEVTSPRFSINRPRVDLLCSSPKIEIEIKRRRRKTKWWEKLGDILSGGFTYYVRKNIEIALLKKAVLNIDFNLKNYGTDNLRYAEVSWGIITRDGYPVYESEIERLIHVYSGVNYPYRFSKDLSQLNLSPMNYIIEIWLDPYNKLKEPERLRKNNRIAVDFNVEK